MWVLLLIIVTSNAATTSMTYFADRDHCMATAKAVAADMAESLRKDWPHGIVYVHCSDTGQ